MTASNWNDLIGYINENPSEHSNPCTQKGNGWRIPNVRELSIMKNLHVLDPDTPSNNNSYVFNIPFLSCSMGIIDGNGTKQLQVSDFNATTSTPTHNFMSALYQKHNRSQNYKIDFFITQSWYGGTYDQGGYRTGTGYYIRCVRDL